MKYRDLLAHAHLKQNQSLDLVAVIHSLPARYLKLKMGKGFTELGIILIPTLILGRIRIRIFNLNLVLSFAVCLASCASYKANSRF